MTDLLYLPDRNYDKAFQAEVTETNEEEGYVVLDRTLFYPEGGGQPADHGRIEWEGGEASVVDVQKSGGDAKHFLEGGLPGKGVEVHGEIDWERRYTNMRMHTAQHLVSWIVLNMYDATTAGNQIHQDYSRIDFEPADFDERDLEKIENGVNSLIEKGLEVEKSNMPREEAEEKTQEGRTNFDLIPDSVDPLRVVEIGGEDICPCGGTHVDNTEEVKGIEIVERKSKGANTERIVFELVE